MIPELASDKRRLEDTPLREITWELLHCYTREDLVRFQRNVMGGAWSAIRSKSKDDLIIEVCQWVDRHKDEDDMPEPGIENAGRLGHLEWDVNPHALTVKVGDTMNKKGAWFLVNIEGCWLIQPGRPSKLLARWPSKNA